MTNEKNYRYTGHAKLATYSGAFSILPEIETPIDFDHLQLKGVLKAILKGNEIEFEFNSQTPITNFQSFKNVVEYQLRTASSYGVFFSGFRQFLYVADIFDEAGKRILIDDSIPELRVNQRINQHDVIELLKRPETARDIHGILQDIDFACLFPTDTSTFCYRALETTRDMLLSLSPEYSHLSKRGGANAWIAFWQHLNRTPDPRVKNLTTKSQESRHGRRLDVSGPTRMEQFAGTIETIDSALIKARSMLEASG